MNCIYDIHLWFNVSGVLVVRETFHKQDQSWALNLCQPSGSYWEGTCESQTHTEVSGVWNPEHNVIWCWTDLFTVIGWQLNCSNYKIENFLNCTKHISCLARES